MRRPNVGVRCRGQVQRRSALVRLKRSAYVTERAKADTLAELGERTMTRDGANNSDDPILTPRRRPSPDASDASISGLRKRPPTRVVENPAVLAYSLENIFVMIWRGGTTDAALDEIHGALSRIVALHDQGIAIVSIIARGTPPPSAAHRARVRDFQETVANRLRCLAIVIEGIGFWASAVLGAATAIVSARRSPFPQKICRTEIEAIMFVASKCEGTPSGDSKLIARCFEFAHEDAAAHPPR